ncbi:MAG: hypothetical protein ACO3FI_00615 [Cyclobacteriaceae bacterium]
MKKIVLFFSIFSLIGITGCEKDDPGIKDFDYLVFGTFYGFCQGEGCIEIFKVTGADVYEDTRDIYPTNDPPYSGNFVKMDRSFYQLAKGLENEIPARLLNTKEKVIGQPDAGDWGGIYFEISVNGKREYWIIDANTLNLPEYLIPFVEEIIKRVTALQPD